MTIVTDAAQAAQTPWKKRAMRMPVVRILLAALVLSTGAFLPEAVFHSWVPKAWRPVWPELVSALLAFYSYRLYIQRVEHRVATEVATRSAVSELGAGLGLGFMLVSAVMAVLAACGAYHLQRVNAFDLALIEPFGLMVLVGTFEELLFRAILFRITAQAWGERWALLVSSVLFGLAHLPGDSSTSLSIFITVVASILLTAAYMSTGRIWLSIGIHIGWNYTLGTIWSIAVSGHEVKEGLFLGQLGGPDWLTGGAYGLEGSVVSLAVLAIASVAMFHRRISSGRGMAALQGRC